VTTAAMLLASSTNKINGALVEYSLPELRIQDLPTYAENAKIVNVVKIIKCIQAVQSTTKARN